MKYFLIICLVFGLNTNKDSLNLNLLSPTTGLKENFVFIDNIDDLIVGNKFHLFGKLFQIETVTGERVEDLFTIKEVNGFDRYYASKYHHLEEDENFFVHDNVKEWANRMSTSINRPDSPIIFPKQTYKTNVYPFFLKELVSLYDFLEEKHTTHDVIRVLINLIEGTKTVHEKYGVGIGMLFSKKIFLNRSDYRIYFVLDENSFVLDKDKSSYRYKTMLLREYLFLWEKLHYSLTRQDDYLESYSDNPNAPEVLKYTDMNSLFEEILSVCFTLETEMRIPIKFQEPIQNLYKKWGNRIKQEEGFTLKDFKGFIEDFSLVSKKVMDQHLPIELPGKRKVERKNFKSFFTLNEGSPVYINGEEYKVHQKIDKDSFIAQLENKFFFIRRNIELLELRKMETTLEQEALDLVHELFWEGHEYKLIEKKKYLKEIKLSEEDLKNFDEYPNILLPVEVEDPVWGPIQIYSYVSNLTSFKKYLNSNLEKGRFDLDKILTLSKNVIESTRLLNAKGIFIEDDVVYFDDQNQVFFMINFSQFNKKDVEEMDLFYLWKYLYGALRKKELTALEEEWLLTKLNKKDFVSSVIETLSSFDEEDDERKLDLKKHPNLNQLFRIVNSFLDEVSVPGLKRFCDELIKYVESPLFKEVQQLSNFYNLETAI